MSEQPQPISKTEITKLPRWARAALAVRCARRVYPLLTNLWHNIPSTDLTLINTSLNASENAVASGKPLAIGADDELGRIRLMALAKAQSSGDDKLSCAMLVVSCIQHAVAAVAEQFAPAYDVSHADKTCQCLVIACEAVSEEAQDSAASSIRMDLKTLTDLATEDAWNDSTSVNTKVCGDLWPNGEPDGWPA
jgi:hypothetical protein